MNPVRRCIAKYSLATERLEAEFDVTPLPLEQLQRLYPDALSHDPLLYEGYRIGPEQVAVLQPHVTEPFDLLANEYLIEAYQAEDTTERSVTGGSVDPLHAPVVARGG